MKNTQPKCRDKPSDKYSYRESRVSFVRRVCSDRIDDGDWTAVAAAMFCRSGDAGSWHRSLLWRLWTFVDLHKVISIIKFRVTASALREIK